jgi:hypothetical protein
MPLIGTILALSLAAIPASLTAHAVQYVRRARRRNAAERCGHCAGALYAAPHYEPPHLVQGIQTCAPCARQGRRRLAMALGGAAALTGLAVVGGTAIAATSALGPVSEVAPALLLAEYGMVFGGAVVWVKRQTREGGRRFGYGGR